MTLLRAACLLLLATAGVAAWAKEQPVPFDSPATKAFAERLASDLKSGKLLNLSARKLGRDYASNEVSADAAYKDRYMLVVGVVDSVRKDAFDNVVVQLRSSNQFLPVNARFDKTVAVLQGMEDDTSKAVTMTTGSIAEAVGPLRKGQTIRLLCKGNGMLLGSAQLTLCDTLSK